MSNWTVTETGRNVHEIRFDDDIRTGWEQRVLLTADRHWDNQHSDHKLQIKHLERAKEIDAPIIDVGDLFCAMQGKFDPRKSDTALRPEHRGDNYFDLLLDTAESFFAPYANQFAVIGTGNHESSILRHNQINLTTNIAKRLQRHSTHDGPFAGGYGGYVLFRFRYQKTVTTTRRLKYFHGSGGGGPVTKGVIQTNRRAVYLPDADIIVSGHIHEAWCLPMTRERITQRGNIYLDNQWHVCAPTYKEEYDGGFGGFHVERGRPPKPVGCVWLVFSMEDDAIKMRAELDIA